MPTCPTCGGMKTVVVNVQQTCTSCDGSGTDDLGHTCQTCHGTGKMTVAEEKTCPTCHGKGYVGSGFSQ
jgi:DnaJ-class molecular chaperone